MRKFVLIGASLMLIGAGALVTFNLGGAPASATTPQISITGKLVAGRYGQAGVPIMLKFKVHNQGSTAYSPLYISYFVSSNGSVGSIVCVEPHTGAITPYNVDNTCSLGYPLGAHETNQSALLVNAISDPPNLTVKACVGHAAKAQTFCNTQVVFLND